VRVVARAVLDAMYLALGIEAELRFGRIELQCAALRAP